MFKEGNIVKVINPNYSTYGMIGIVQRNYKITTFTTSVIQYGRTDYIQLKPETGYKEGDDIYVSFGKPVIGVLNTGVFAKEDLKLLWENSLVRDYGETALRGYGIFVSGVNEMPLEHIERIDELGVYEDDHEASEQAKKDGIKILETHFVNESFCYYNGTIIDTEENRKMLEDIQAENKYFR